MVKYFYLRRLLQIDAYIAFGRVRLHKEVVEEEVQKGYEGISVDMPFIALYSVF